MVRKKIIMSPFEFMDKFKPRHEKLMKQNNIPYRIVRSRVLKQGMTIQDAVTKPYKVRKSKYGEEYMDKLNEQGGNLPVCENSIRRRITNGMSVEEAFYTRSHGMLVGNEYGKK